MFHKGQKFTSLVVSFITLWGYSHLTFQCPPKLLHSPYRSSHNHTKMLCSHIMCGTMAVLKWTKPQSLPFNVSDGIIWVTVTVIPSTKVNSVRVWHTHDGTYEECCWHHNLWVSWSPLKSALRDRVRAKVGFPGNACFRLVLFKLLM